MYSTTKSHFNTELQQLRSQNEIIVMELCSGGSLFTLLENPANAYGFMEDEFKQVLKDVGKIIIMNHPSLIKKYLHWLLSPWCFLESE